MKISVIAIFYNSEKYVRKCMDSILAQRDVSIEIITVDDCSTDATLEILKEYALRHPNIVIVNHEFNQGISAARNSGLSEITGDCFFLIDGDDYLPSSDALRSLSEKYENDVDWVQGSYVKCNERDDEIGKMEFKDNCLCGYNAICDSFDSFNFIYTHNKLINAKYKSNKFNTGCYHEDRMWNVSVFNGLRKIVSVSTPTYSYVVRSGQTSNKSRSKRLYIESGMSLMRMMVNCPVCWKVLRDTFQVVDIEKPLYLWEPDDEYRRRILNELRMLNTMEISTVGFPRFTRIIHWMIKKSVPDFFINVISKSYVRTMTCIDRSI
nr:glycosyltransferase family 2 protein [Bacteroides acidifaciens]